jgi:cellobiose-specific phosphotransferase system component IIB
MKILVIRTENEDENSRLEAVAKELYNNAAIDYQDFRTSAMPESKLVDESSNYDAVLMSPKLTRERFNQANVGDLH